MLMVVLMAALMAELKAGYLGMMLEENSSGQELVQRLVLCFSYESHSKQCLHV